MTVKNFEKVETLTNVFQLESIDLRLISAFEVKKNIAFGDPF